MNLTTVQIKKAQRRFQEMLYLEQWDEITSAVNAFTALYPKAFGQCWMPVWRKTRQTWPSGTEKLMTREELQCLSRVALRRLFMENTGASNKEATEQASVDQREALLTLGVKREIPPPPRPMPPCWKECDVLMDHLRDLAYRTYHVLPDHYLKDCLQTLQKLLDLCEEYALDPYEETFAAGFAWEDHFPKKPTARKLFKIGPFSETYERMKGGLQYSELLHPVFFDKENGKGSWEAEYAEEYYSHFVDCEEKACTGTTSV